MNVQTVHTVPIQGTTTVYPNQQQPTVIVVNQGPPGYYNRHGRWVNRAPLSLQGGIKVGGLVLGLPLIIALGFFGFTFTLGGIMSLTTTGIVSVGAILLLIGVILLSSSIGLACYVKKKYNSMSGGNPGRVINRNSEQQQPLNSQQLPGTLPSTGFGGAGGAYPPPVGGPAYPVPAGGPSYPSAAGGTTYPYPAGGSPYLPPAGGSPYLPPAESFNNTKGSEYDVPPPYAPNAPNPNDYFVPK